MQVVSVTDVDSPPVFPKDRCDVAILSGPLFFSKQNAGIVMYYSGGVSQTVLISRVTLFSS